MKTNDLDIKEMVKQKYSEIALQDKQTNQSSCCGAGDCSTEVYNIMNDEYGNLRGYAPDADLGLGCGLPTEFARISPGDTVIDLGSGAGNDCFVARAETGPTGKVIGIDFAPPMIAKARTNADKLGYNNVEFRAGDIEQMPVADAAADVVVSNCVLNLLPDKSAIFGEIYRVLRPGGHFSISDIVATGALPANIQRAGEMYAGCVSGAIQLDAYLEHVRQAGFVKIKIQKQKDIVVPADILRNYLSEAEMASYLSQPTPIKSITLYAEKPTADCAPDSGCC